MTDQHDIAELRTQHVVSHKMAGLRPDGVYLDLLALAEAALDVVNAQGKGSFDVMLYKKLEDAARRFK